MNPEIQKSPAGKYRWIICGLLLFSTTVNYMDRQVISYVKEFYCTPVEKGGFGWTNSDFANVTTVFTGFYAGMTILAGWVIDRIGTKIGLALSLIVWSIFGILNAFVGSMTWMHMIVRSLFGIGEAGNFPASIKTVAEWFPKRERSLATGIFNSGSNIGAMISALFVPWCLGHYGDQNGWKMAYILTGAVGFLWLIFWFWLYAPPAHQKRLSKEEYDYIHSDKDENKSVEIAGEKSPSKTSSSLFSFSGRIPAAGFLGVTSMVVFLCMFVFFISRMFPSLSERYAVIIYATFGSIGLWVAFAAQVKRWHDLGKSGLLALPNLMLVIGFLGILYLIRLKLGKLDFDVAHFQARFLTSKYALAASALACVGLVTTFILGTRSGERASNQFGEATTSGLLGYRQTWSFFFGKFFTDGVWWFYLFWLPDYLHKQFDMTKRQVMLPTFIVYGVSIIGSVYGGSLPMSLMKRGMQAYKARMTAMFIIALFPMTVLSTQYFGNVEHFGKWASYLAVAVICIGAAAHQAWSANLFTTVSDMFPKKSVGAVVGIGAMAGGLGGVIVQKIAGTLTDTFKDNPQHAYLIMFVVCALSYLIAWTIMKLLVPAHKPITDL
jgi:MFS family permease